MQIKKRPYLALVYRAVHICLSLGFILFSLNGNAQTPLPNIIQAEYYFDIDPGPGQGIPIPVISADSIDMSFSASIAHLIPGYHKLVIRIRDGVFGWSTHQTHLFHVNPLISPILPPLPPFTLVGAEYFFDNDPGVGNGTAIPLIAGDSVSILRNISTTNLPNGPHTLCLRFKDLAGSWSHISTYDVLLNQDSLNILAGAIADFNWSTPVAGQPVQFTNTSSNVSAPHQYQWDMGANGSVEYFGQNMQHTFSQPGIYDVLMRVSLKGTRIDTSNLKAMYRFFNGSRANYHGPLGTLIRQGGVNNAIGRHGDENGAYSTEGTNNIAYLTSSAVPLNMQELSVSYWFKGDNSSYVLNLLDDQNNGAISTLNNRHTVYGNAAIAYASSALNDGKWHHLAFTWLPNNGSGFKVYFDGQLSLTGGASNQSLNALDSLVLGANGLNEADGSFDDVFIFNRILTDSEIFTLYNEAVTDAVVKQIMVGPIPANAIISSGADTICSGDSLILAGPQGTDHVWSTGDTTQQIIVKELGIYICAYTDIYGNSRTSESKNILVHESPRISVSVSSASNGNANGSIRLDIDGGSGNYTINWLHTAQGAQLVQLAGGVYQVTINDGYCPQQLSITVADSTFAITDEIIALEAFFDIDPGVGNGISLAVPQYNQIDIFQDISIAGLVPGRHSLNTRVLSKGGTWSIISHDHFYVKDTASPAIDTLKPIGDVVLAEYFFDVDPGPSNGYSLPITPSDSFIDVNLNLQTLNLRTGIHVLAVRVKDSNGKWSIIAVDDILIDVLAPPNLPAFRLPIVAAEYFFDNQDPGPGQALPLNITIQDSTLEIGRSVNIAGLNVGSHKLGIRVRDIRGQWSTLQQNDFVVASSCTPPVASFSYANAQANVPVSFANTSTGLSALAMYYWDIDADGTTDYTTANIQHSFPQAGMYDVKLSVVNLDSCYSEIVQTITVGPLPSAQIGVSGSLVFCSGETRILTAPAGSNYIWNTLDTTQSIEVSLSGVYRASYVDSQNRLRQTPAVGITIFPSMDIQWQIAPEINGLGNGGIRLFIQGGSTYKPSIVWSTGDTTSMLSNSAAGTYSVVIDDGNCPQTLNFSIPASSVQPINGIISAEYILGEIDPGPGFGQALTVNPGANSNSMTQLSTQGLAPGIYRMYLRVMEVDGDWSHIYPYRVFRVLDTVEVVNEIYTLNAAEYFFDEDPGPGNGIASPPFTPIDSIDLSITASIAGLQTGSHKVFLRVRNSGGLWSTAKERIFYIDSLPSMVLPTWALVEAEYFIGNVDPGTGKAIPISIPVGDSVNLTRIVDVSQLAIGTHSIYLRIKNQVGLWSHLSSFHVIIQTRNCVMPSADFVYTNTAAGQLTSFFNTSINVLPSAVISWDIDSDGVTDYTTNNPTHTFVSAGIYDVLLTVDNGGGCVQQIVKTIAVGPLPGTQISLSGSTEFCDCDSLVLTAPAADRYLWNTGDTTASIATRQSGLFNVVLTDNIGNQIQTASEQVIAHPTPTISTQASPAYNGASDGTAAVLSVHGGSGYLFDYLWSTGDSTWFANDLSAGTYWVTVTDPYCSVTDTVVIQSVSLNPPTGIVTAEYFFDGQDPGPGQANPLVYGFGALTASTESIPLLGLAPGTHSLWVRVREETGFWSSLERKFITISDTVEPLQWPEAQITDVEYFIDVDQGPGQMVSIASGLQTDQLDTSLSVVMPNLVGGLHDFGIRVKDELGNWSIIKVHEINNCVPPPVPFAGLDRVVCRGDTLHLSSTFVGADPVYWLAPNGNTYSGKNPAILASDSTFEGLYLVYSEGNNSCRSAFDTVLVDVLETPLNPGDIQMSPIAACALGDTINLLVQHQEDVVNYQWLLPPGAFILAGNNTNGVTVDLSNWADSSAIVRVVVSNSCGADTSNLFALTRCGNVLPVVATSASYALSGDSASTGGIIISAGASALIRAGVCLSTQLLPDTSDRVLETLPLTGSFGIIADGLAQSTTYYVRAFAENAQGITYGNTLSFAMPINCQITIDSTLAVNANLGVYRAYFGMLPGTSWELEYKGVNEVNWKSKTISRATQGNQKFNVTPSFGTDVLVRIVSHDAVGTSIGCESTFSVPCKQQNLGIVIQKSAFCAGDSVLLRAGYSGGYRTPSFLWSNGATTKRTFASQGEKLMVTVTDLAGCSVTDSITVPFLSTVGTPNGFTLSKDNATTFTGNWTAASLPTGASLIGYRMAYRQANVGASWITTSLLFNTTATIDFTGSGNGSANYEFTAFARINDNGSVYNTKYACLDRKFYNGSGNKSEETNAGEWEGSRIAIYPNPTNNNVYVQSQLGAKIQLFDLHGKLLSQKEALSNETAFDLSAYAKGVYLMKITTDEQVIAKQVMKN